MPLNSGSSKRMSRKERKEKKLKQEAELDAAQSNAENRKPTSSVLPLKHSTETTKAIGLFA